MGTGFESRYGGLEMKYVVKLSWAMASIERVFKRGAAADKGMLQG